jgi:hypothetical protein
MWRTLTATVCRCRTRESGNVAHPHPSPLPQAGEGEEFGISPSPPERGRGPGARGGDVAPPCAVADRVDEAFTGAPKQNPRGKARGFCLSVKPKAT